jgi:hypothetical protein
MKMEVPAVSGITAIDTIGADNFLGFISALLEGKPLRGARGLLTQRPQYRY